MTSDDLFRKYQHKRDNRTHVRAAGFVGLFIAGCALGWFVGLQVFPERTITVTPEEFVQRNVDAKCQHLNCGKNATWVTVEIAAELDESIARQQKLHPSQDVRGEVYLPANKSVAFCDQHVEKGGPYPLKTRGGGPFIAALIIGIGVTWLGGNFLPPPLLFEFVNRKH